MNLCQSEQMPREKEGFTVECLCYNQACDDDRVSVFNFVSEIVIARCTFCLAISAKKDDSLLSQYRCPLPSCAAKLCCQALRLRSSEAVSASFATVANRVFFSRGKVESGSSSIDFRIGKRVDPTELSFPWLTAQHSLSFELHHRLQRSIGEETSSASPWLATLWG